MVKRYRPFGAAMTRSNDGEWVRHDDVLAALQTLIDQLATNHEWRNGAVLAYNAISCSEQETPAEPIDQAPIARVVVTEDAPAGVVLYAPGLPPGEFDVYLEPASDYGEKK